MAPNHNCHRPFLLSPLCRHQSKHPKVSKQLARMVVARSSSHGPVWFILTCCPSNPSRPRSIIVSCLALKCGMAGQARPIVYRAHADQVCCPLGPYWSGRLSVLCLGLGCGSMGSSRYDPILFFHDFYKKNYIMLEYTNIKTYTLCWLGDIYVFGTNTHG